MKSLKMPYLIRLIDLLNLTETELLKAVISEFSPCQPSALYGAWKKRAGYAPPESTALIWELFDLADFKCTSKGCGSPHRISLDHINRDKMDSSRKNLRVLCFSCNRARVGMARKKHLSAEVVKAVFDLIDTQERFPSNQEIAKRIDISPSQLGGTIYFIRVLRKRFGERAGMDH